MKQFKDDELRGSFRMAKICIIDDDEDVNLMLVHLLGNEYEVAAYENWKEGVEAIGASPPNLILLDLSLPGTTGHSVLQLIRGKERLANIPILALTAAQVSEGKEAFIKQGFNGYIPKPITDRSSLLHAIRQLTMES